MAYFCCRGGQKPDDELVVCTCTRTCDCTCNGCLCASVSSHAQKG